MAGSRIGRRGILFGAVAAPVSILAVACSDNHAKEVGAIEDLMREHGVLRRAFLIYQEFAVRLRTDDKRVDGNALHETAQLFRTFGEDYHERTLEEAHIFPAVRKAGGLAAGYVNVLKDQHARGRAITDYILSVTGNGSISTGNAEPLARALETFQIMYANHAAREDTIVFPALKSALSEHDLDEMGDKFEDIEKQMFGKDGFEDAVGRIGRIEKSLGFSDLAQFTAPLPPATGTP